MMVSIGPHHAASPAAMLVLAVYESRRATGVIIIRTHRGKE